MGYEVHITRKENWFDDGPGISLAEWLEVVRADAEMRHDGYAETVVADGSILRVEDPGLAVWLAYSKHGLAGNMAWLWHSSGNVVAKNPDEEIFGKMAQIAQRFSAKVQGEEGEIYGPDGQVIETASRSRSDATKPWWRFW